MLYEVITQRRVCPTRLFALIAACVVAAGCAVEEESDSNNHGFGFEYEAQATNGLTLRNEPDVVEPIELAVLADIYDQTQARITSYNVCYTKLLRNDKSSGLLSVCIQFERRAFWKTQARRRPQPG